LDLRAGGHTCGFARSRHPDALVEPAGGGVIAVGPDTIEICRSVGSGQLRPMRGASGDVRRALTAASSSWGSVRRTLTCEWYSGCSALGLRSPARFSIRVAGYRFAPSSAASQLFLSPIKYETRSTQGSSLGKVKAWTGRVECEDASDWAGKCQGGARYCPALLCTRCCVCGSTCGRSTRHRPRLLPKGSECRRVNSRRRHGRARSSRSDHRRSHKVARSA